jgi:hypothetical protein
MHLTARVVPRWWPVEIIETTPRPKIHVQFRHVTPAGPASQRRGESSDFTALLDGPLAAIPLERLRTRSSR